MRAHNFSAGPAGLPLEALEQARDELLDFEGTGMSILEQSHRDAPYAAVHAEVQSLIRELTGAPESHDVLLLQGGASLQFAMVPMNFLRRGKSADYLMTGVWSDKALVEAQLVGNARIAGSTLRADGRYTSIPRTEQISLDPSAAYVHLTSNNTVFGTQWHRYPDTGKVPLVADFSSDFLSRPVDVSRFKLIYAGAQKNLGPAGLTIVLVDREWAREGRQDIPTMLRYRTHSEADSLYNTPPTLSIYLTRNVLRWLKAQGGTAAMAARNADKAQRLYAALEGCGDFYRLPVAREDRSVMNVVFTLGDASLEKPFLTGAKAARLIGLKGHRLAGGMRASLYNAVSPADVDALVDYVKDFARRNG